jgi:hypothetical protein
LPIQHDQDSLEALAVQSLAGTITVGGRRYQGLGGPAYIWRLDPQLETVEETLVSGATFSSIYDLAATPEQHLVAAGYGSDTLPTNLVAWGIGADLTSMDWAFLDGQGAFKSLAVSLLEPAVYVGGEDYSDTTAPLTVCKISR